MGNTLDAWIGETFPDGEKSDGKNRDILGLDSTSRTIPKERRSFFVEDQPGSLKFIMGNGTKCEANFEASP